MEPVSISHVYLLTNALGLMAYFILSRTLKDVRNDMAVAGFIVGLLSVVTGWVWWTKDWWSPPTITKTIVGIEDFFLGFVVGGVAVALCHLVLAISPGDVNRRDYGFIIKLCLIFPGLMSVAFWVFGLSSFWSSVVALALLHLYFAIENPNWMYRSILFGILFATVQIPMYILAQSLNETWPIHTWQSMNLSGIVLLGFIPIEEMVFWLLFGALAVPIVRRWFHV